MSFLVDCLKMAEQEAVDCEEQRRQADVRKKNNKKRLARTGTV